MFYAYVLESEIEPSRHYIGHTTDLAQRLLDHNAGTSPHTSKLRPWRVKFYAAFESLELARSFERYLKSGSGHAFAHKHLGF
ncbi:MAG: excinuclease ABC subunit C [Verrucomicrobia bacterium A1]|nr:MAG: excinuclease ABC subunit C [Verrucomicrobia bacterium A1]